MVHTDWMQIGKEHTEGNEKHLEKIFSSMEWLDISLPENQTQAMCPGMAINTLIAELHIPKVTHIAISHELAPYGLYGIRGHYKGNKEVDIFFCDEGCQCVTLAAHVKEPERMEV